MNKKKSQFVIFSIAFLLIRIQFEMDQSDNAKKIIPSTRREWTSENFCWRIEFQNF